VKPIVSCSPDQVRANLRSLAAKHKVSLAALSRMLRRPDRYLSNFGLGSAPPPLADYEQKLLAAYFRVEPRVFGAKEDWEP